MASRTRQIETDPIKELYGRIARLEAEVRELRAGRRLEAATIDRGGITVQDDGGIRVQGDSGPVAVLGDLADVLGTGSHGVWLGRPGGGTAFASFGTSGGAADGFAGLYDLAGNYVFASDTQSRRGLARPYLPLTLGEISFPTATTTSGTFTNLASGTNSLQHPVLYATLLVRASDGTTTGEARLTLDGTAIGPVLTIGAGAYAVSAIGPFAVPSPGTYGSLRTLAVQARRTAGTGNVGVRVMSILGLESSWV